MWGHQEQCDGSREAGGPECRGSQAGWWNRHIWCGGDVPKMRACGAKRSSSPARPRGPDLLGRINRTWPRRASCRREPVRPGPSLERVSRIGTASSAWKLHARANRRRSGGTFAEWWSFRATNVQPTSGRGSGVVNWHGPDPAIHRTSARGAIGVMSGLACLLAVDVGSAPARRPCAAPPCPVRL